MNFRGRLRGIGDGEAGGADGEQQQASGAPLQDSGDDPVFLGDCVIH